MEIILALVLFIGLIVSWVMLPGVATSTVDTEAEATGLGRTTVGQGA